MKTAVTTPILQLQNLAVSRGKNFTLQIKKLSLDSGGIVCVVGANGSGKTTMIEAIVGLVKASGIVLVNGAPCETDSRRLRRLTGYIPDDDAWIIPELTAREYFALLASVYKDAGVTVNLTGSVGYLADELSFTNFSAQLGALSHGNKKKVQIIAALMHKPELLVIDELRNGLDPIAIKRAEDLVRSYSLNGTGVLAATHDLWWAQRLAKTVVMIKHGKLVYQASTKDIVAQFGSLEAKFMELYGKNE